MISKTISWSAKAGAGKSFIINALLRKHYPKLLPCASTGVAAGELFKGQTAHKLFGLRSAEDKICSIVGPRSVKAQILKETEGFVLDEAFMMDNRCLMAIDQLLRSLVEQPGFKNSPFGGKFFLFVGDYKQLPPVVPDKGTKKAHQSKYTMLNRHFKATKYYNPKSELHLTQSIRAKDDPEFATWVDDVGHDRKILERLEEERQNIIMPGFIEYMQDFQESLNWLLPDFEYFTQHPFHR